MLNSLLADSIARIRNGYMAGKEQVMLFHSKFLEKFLSVLRKEGYISDFETISQPSQKKGGQEIKKIMVNLSYFNKKPSMMNIRLISTPGRQYYIRRDQILDYYNKFAHSGVGTLILSTNKGVVAGHEAVMHGQGGNLLCTVF